MNTAFINAKVYIERGRFEQALLVKDGIIEAAGTDADIVSLAATAVPSETRIIDCRGSTIIPGLNDSHMHLLMVGAGLYQADITGVSSIDEMIDRVRRFMQKYPERCKGGIHSVGWNQDLFTGDKRIPTRHDLDRISTALPVVLERICGHVVTANTKAIELLGLGIGSSQFEGGTFELEEDGYPSGVFTEGACGRILSVIPEYTMQQSEAMFMQAMDYAVSRGITSVQSNDAGTTAPASLVLPMVNGIFAQGKAKLKYHHQVCFNDADSFRRYIETEYKEYRQNGSVHPWLTYGPLKLFKDGSLGGRTAMMSAGYLDDKGNYGVEAMSGGVMLELVRLADENGIQAVTHVIGDKAIEETLKCYEAVLHDGKDKNPLRHGLVHCQITDMPLLERIVRDDVIVMYQPIFLDYDMHAVIPRCGEELSSTSYAFGTMARLGAHVSYGTDSPVEDCDPFANIYAAVTRKDRHGYPEGGFFPNERVDIYTAIDAYTSGSAYAQFMESSKGRLKAGYAADLVMLDKDIFTIDPMEIPSVRPVLTMVGGRIVYEG